MSKPIGIPDMIWDNRAMIPSPGDGAELGKEHEPCFVEEVDGTTVLTSLSLALEIGISLKPFDGAKGGEG